MQSSGLEYVPTQLKKPFVVNESSELDSSLAIILSYTWDEIMTVKELVADLHGRHDKIA